MERRLFSFLVVDDEREAADSLASVLRLSGHDCVVAYDGKAALDESKRFHTDVVVLDINMPGLDGIATAHCFLSAQTAHTPVLIALTGFASKEMRLEAMRSGFDALLTKPVNPNRLIDVARKLVEDRRLSTYPSHAQSPVPRAPADRPYRRDDRHQQA